MPTKLRIKFKTFELEFEGEDKFAKADLLELIDKVHSFANTILDDQEGEDSEDHSGAGDENGKSDGWSTSKIAQKIGGNTGTKLVIAALAYHCIVKRRALATRKQIVDEMKLATAFYRDTFRKNLTSTLRSLVKSGKIHENGTDNFALSDSLLNSTKAQLA